MKYRSFLKFSSIALLYLSIILAVNFFRSLPLLKTLLHCFFFKNHSKRNSQELLDQNDLLSASTYFLVSHLTLYVIGNTKLNPTIWASSKRVILNDEDIPWCLIDIVTTLAANFIQKLHNRSGVPKRNRTTPLRSKFFRPEIQ